MKIEGKVMQLVARSKAEAAEEGAEIKEAEVATSRATSATCSSIR